MKKSLICLVMAMLVFVGCSKMVKLETYDFPVNRTLTRDQVKTAIFEGCQDRGWIAEEKDDSTISARLLNRGKYEVYIDIVYGETNYQVIYVKSVNLRATDKKIHKAYKKWVLYLKKSINAALFKI